MSAIAVEEGELVELRPMTPPNAQGRRFIVTDERRGYGPHELDLLLVDAARLAPRCEVYVGVNPRRDAAEGQAVRGRKQDIACVRCVVADLDDDGGLDAAATCGLPSPSVVVASGSKTASGRPKVHAWWALDAPLSVPEAEPLLKAVAHELRGDIKVAQAAAVLRLPGTLNHKNDPPTAVEIVGGATS